MRTALRQSIIASLLAAVWVVVPLLAAIHIAVEEHSFCAEHGALEEGGGHQDSPHLLAKNAEEAPRDSLRPRSTRDSNSEEHAACALADQATHDMTPLELGVFITPATVASTAAPFVVIASTRAPFDILSGAPKTSPPLGS